jgi:predicted KAP-like P-loop ATPase
VAHDCEYYRKSVGIFGEWGSGKTKLLKGIDNYFKKNHDNIIPVFFNAWRFEKDKHIIIPLFKTMLGVLKKISISSSHFLRLCLTKLNKEMIKMAKTYWKILEF